MPRTKGATSLAHLTEEEKRERKRQRNRDAYERKGDGLEKEALIRKREARQAAMENPGWRACSKCKNRLPEASFPVAAATSLKTIYASCTECLDKMKVYDESEGSKGSRDRERSKRQKARVLASLQGRPGFEEKVTACSAGVPCRAPLPRQSLQAMEESTSLVDHGRCILTLNLTLGI